MDLDPVKKYRIFLIVCCANLGSFSVGIYVGWTSPVIPKLRANSADSPLNFGVSTAQEGWIGALVSIGAFLVKVSKICTSAQEGWIGALVSIGAFLGALTAGLIASKFGRKFTLLSSSLFFISSYMCLIIGRSIGVIYVARILQGLGGGIVTTLTPMYIGEIATDDFRGALGSLILLFMSCGLVFVYSIGPYVSFMTLQWICISIPVLFFGTFCFMPETPYYYAMKNRTADGIRSLRYLRGQNSKTTEITMEHIQNEVDKSMLNKGSIADIFRNRAYRKALLIGSGLLIFQQLSGTKAVLVNSQSIFTSANSSLDPAIATIIVGLCQLVSNLLTPYVVERAGRKIVLLISSCGMCLTLVILGTFFYIQKHGDVSYILWLPIPTLIGFNLLFGFGFGPIPWAVLGEMFPSNIKSSATTITCSLTWLTSFAVVRWFPELNALGPYYAFWLFSIMCGLAFFFVLFVVIETKGISLQKIQEKLQA
ncbi:facilitated trehalose transporter Tret1-like [Eupeodes corollae]|uniref:facilitated trehalose transporter Tret1-like n=1 Tax=Eupeodes corollae TaxID=290404 RepID=UPI0024936F40|nr:facilitated trehalose transporter Tret1-like [Eupeodes corollae]